MAHLEPHMVSLDVPGLGNVTYHRPRIGRPGTWRYGRADPRWSDGSEMDADEENIARRYWGEHPEMH